MNKFINQFENWIPHNIQTNFNITKISFLYKNNFTEGIGFNITLDDEWMNIFCDVIELYKKEQTKENILGYTKQLEEMIPFFRKQNLEKYGNANSFDAKQTSLIFANIYFSILYGLLKDDEYNGICLFGNIKKSQNIGGYKLKAKETALSISYIIPEKIIKL